MKLNTEVRTLVVEALARRARNRTLNEDNVFAYIREETGDELAINTAGLVACELLEFIASRSRMPKPAPSLTRLPEWTPDTVRANVAGASHLDALAITLNGAEQFAYDKCMEFENLIDLSSLPKFGGLPARAGVLGTAFSWDENRRLSCENRDGYRRWFVEPREDVTA